MEQEKIINNIQLSNEITSSLKNLMELWSEQVVDKEYGGYLTCRNRDFSLYDTKKGAWGQARHIWTYSMMAEFDHNNKDRWLGLAEVGIDFVINKMMCPNNRIAYLTDQKGAIIDGPISIFSDAFTILGIAKYISVSKGNRYISLLNKMFSTYVKNIQNTNFRDIAPNIFMPNVMHHAVYMISVNCAYEVASVLGKNTVQSFLEYCLNTVLTKFYDNEYGVVLEKKMLDGSRTHTSDSLFMNTGHVFESMWFALDATILLEKNELIPVIEQITENTFNLGTTDGLMTFSRTLGDKPSNYQTWKYELSFKDTDRVCWGYAEAMVLFIYLYKLTGKQKWFDRFLNHYQYVRNHFEDKKFGDWFHALDFNGKVIADMKGSTVKDAYHIPRAYRKILDILKEI